MALEKYTNTYQDVDETIIDHDDLIEEYWRVSEFIGAWAASLDQVSVTANTEQTVYVDGDLTITGAQGLLQRILVQGNVSEFNVNFGPRENGDPYRIVVMLRFQSKDSRFTVSGPAGECHIFGPNRLVYQPSQVIGDGYYAAMIIATYGNNNGCYIQVFADNGETTIVGADDILTEKAV